ncbi:hypothetical protein ACREYJ_28270 [Pseudomonas kribbensis]|uniref:hypothetical protein n=1 Tax=Pseudomonas kribbensis TaxID=1628086 RepID=UPI003D77305A
MDDNSQVSKEKSSSEPLPKGMIRAFLNGGNFALPGLQLSVGKSITLAFADLVGGGFKNKVAMVVKEEYLGMEIDIPEMAHLEIMVGGVLYNDVKGKVKVERVPSPSAKFKGTADVEFNGGKNKFTGVAFDLSDE